jgi:hypothetical protein
LKANKKLQIDVNQVEIGEESSKVRNGHMKSQKQPKEGVHGQQRVKDQGNEAQYWCFLKHIYYILSIYYTYEYSHIM